jgi:hypothetical protein
MTLSVAAHHFLACDWISGRDSKDAMVLEIHDEN